MRLYLDNCLGSNLPSHTFQAGVQIADPIMDVFNGQEVEVWPRITWSPKWALTFSDAKRKVNERCSVSQRSTLVINTSNVILHALSLDGTLIANEAEVFLSLVVFWLFYQLASIF